MAEPTPDEILARVREVYSGCRTYRDTGVVECRYFPLEGGSMWFCERMTFATAFERPDHFRFEYREQELGEDEWMLILWNAGRVRSITTIKPLPVAEQVTKCERASLVGLECYRLHWSLHEGERVTVWVGCTDFLIRQLDEMSLLDGRHLAELDATLPDDVEPPPRQPFRTESSTTYEPVLDAAIEPERFAQPSSWGS